MNIQIANYHISDKSVMEGGGKIHLVPCRQDATHTGVFEVALKVLFDPASAGPEYPAGSVWIKVDLTDSFKGTSTSTTIDQVNTHGKDTPTTVITGKCKVELDEKGKAPKGCRFWILIADNKNPVNGKDTPDIVSFIVFDRTGKRIAYGTGPSDGSIFVAESTL